MTATPRFCHECSEPLEEGDKFCASCRAPVRRSKSPAPRVIKAKRKPAPETWPAHIPRRVPPPPGPGKAAEAKPEEPFRWGRALLVVLLFFLVALGRHYERELGEWLERMFGS